MRGRLSDELSAREFEQQRHEKEMFDKQSEHAIKMKELDLQIAKLEVKYGSLLRLPMALIMLPVRMLFVIPISISAVSKKELPESFWKIFGRWS